MEYQSQAFKNFHEQVFNSHLKDNEHLLPFKYTINNAITPYHSVVLDIITHSGNEGGKEKTEVTFQNSRARTHTHVSQYPWLTLVLAARLH